MFPAEAYKNSALTGIDSCEWAPETLPLFGLAIEPDAVVDGDTLRAEIITPSDWERFLGPARRDTQGRVWIRLLGLDAPETHFPNAPSGLRHQPPQYGQYANDCLMEALGVTASFDDGSVYALYRPTPHPSALRSSNGPTHDSVGLHSHASPRYLIAECHGVDRYGRVLAILWRGNQPDVALAPPRPPALCSSVNVALLAQGAAYPDLHGSLGAQRIAEFRRACKEAQTNRLGIWIHDQSGKGVLLTEAHRLTQDVLILPRLYRRMAAFLQDSEAHHEGAHFSLSERERALRNGFRDFLGHMDQPLYLRSESRCALLSELISWNAPRLKLTAPIEEMEWQ